MCYVSLLDLDSVSVCNFPQVRCCKVDNWIVPIFGNPLAYK